MTSSASTAQLSKADTSTDTGRSVAAQLGNLLATAADHLHIPFADDMRALARRDEIRSHKIWEDHSLRTDGLPIVLVGGMSSTPAMLSVLKEWLERIGCRTLIAPTHFGVGCGEDNVRAVAATARELATAAGRAPVLIAYSRGGQFARVVAVRHPAIVRGLITLGSPLRSLTGVRPLLRAEICALGIAGTLGLPGLFRASCLWGECCRRLRVELGGPFPASVPFLSVYSEQDQMVDWRTCLDPAARLHATRSTHGGLLAHPDVLAAIAAELRRIVRAGAAGTQRHARKQAAA